MELGPVWAEWGLVGLFLAAFLAATILPFSSEAVLLALAAAGGQPMPLFLVATLGNTLGGLTNYGIGRWLPTERIVQRYGADTLRAERWRAYIQRHGAWAALLCWLPVVGDPLALALGLARTAMLPTAILMMLGKGARYAVLLWATDRIITG
ncbi:MAG: DedA family protein [Flavobacteriales bacterium]|nr:DedA family protein [Flavobacteriales bacterium]